LILCGFTAFKPKVGLGKPIVLMCNYQWWKHAYHNRFFTDTDQQEVLQNEKLKLKYLRKEGFKIKDGLMVYGARR